ncbi:MAG: hypothetical protein U5L45_02240 [Saprospiraceae bacterium]|nr:hypothetical protein [Saprospiraceae bacterium]
MVRFSGFARKTNHLSSLARAKRERTCPDLHREGVKSNSTVILVLLFTRQNYTLSHYPALM